MTVTGLDLSQRIARVKGKTGLRTIVYGHTTARELDRYLRVRVSSPWSHVDALWLGKYGPLTDSGIGQMLARRSKMAGLPRIHPHTLRHTWVSRSLSSGIPETVVARLAGWTDGSATKMLLLYGRSTGMTRAVAAYRSPMDDRRQR